MQPRAALARCFANDPEVIVMDEPLGALDALTRDKDAGRCAEALKRNGQDDHSDHLLCRGGVAFGRKLACDRAAADLREVKKHPDYSTERDEILSILWDKEDEIMGRTEAASA